jgi:xylan 1,4-beta-xylosidase
VVASPRNLRNPVLPGFEPDPSILRVGDDYYIATSTFEWYPGVRLHHSKDLLTWRPVGGALRRPEQLDLRGVPDSGGVWAPCLTYADGLFYLVYTVMDSYAEGWKDIANYVVSAPSIEGPWSAPTYLHGRGWDASLFHDEDGSSWLVNMIYDWRLDRPGFAGIEIQEYDRAARELLGAPRTIFTGTDAGVTEGPHLYRHDGWYYLVVAEGGTGVEHQVTIARSRELSGPYEPDPQGAALTAKHDRTLPFQKAGHGCLVQTAAGDWYMAHLTARPYREAGDRCVLGRETAIQQVRWSEDGWPRVPGGVPHGDVLVTAVDVRTPSASPSRGPDDSGFSRDWSTLRRPASAAWIEFDQAGRAVRIKGGQSPTGRRAPSLLAHRVTDPRCSLSAIIDFTPVGPDDLAGIAGYYNTRNWHYVYLTAEEDGTPYVAALSCVAGKLTAHKARRRPARGEDVELGVVFDGPGLRLEPLGVEVDATTLSDEHADEFADGVVRTFGFTGAMVGLWVMDLSGAGAAARFSRVSYACAGRAKAMSGEDLERRSPAVMSA